MICLAVANSIYGPSSIVLGSTAIDLTTQREVCGDKQDNDVNGLLQ